jgi:hypothetical protein
MAFDPKTPTASSGTIQGEPVKRRQGKAQRLNLPPAPAFLYKAHPTRWGIIEGDWCPILSKMKLEPGINGIGHNMSEAGARENARQAGWVVLDPDTIGEDYCIVFAGTRGPVHLEKWVDIKQVGGRVIIKPDMDGYKDFLFRLIDAGHIEPLDDDIKEALVAQQATRLAAKDGKEDRASKAAAKKAAAMLETMKKPAKRKRTKKKVAANV